MSWLTPTADISTAVEAVGWWLSLDTDLPAWGYAIVNATLIS